MYTPILGVCLLYMCTLFVCTKRKNRSDTVFWGLREILKVIDKKQYIVYFEAVLMMLYVREREREIERDRERDGERDRDIE